MDLTFPEELRYDVGHLWVRTENGQAVLGVTDFAQRCWGKVEFAELPAAGERLSAGAPFGQLLCADAGPCDLFAPVTGPVLAANPALSEEPELVNAQPYAGGWLVRIGLDAPVELRNLLDAGAYAQLLRAPAQADVSAALAGIFEHSVDAMILADRYRRIVALNPAAEAFTGYHKPDLADDCRCCHLFRCDVAGGSPYGIECPGVRALGPVPPGNPSVLTITCRDGSRARVSASYSLLPDDGPAGPLLLISLRKAAE